MRRLLTPLLMAAAAIVGAIVGNLSSHSESSRNNQDSFGVRFGGLIRENKLQSVLDLISFSYVDSVDVDSLVENALPGILENLDPHSVYIPAKDLQHVTDELKSDFGGVGISFSIYEDTINVISVISGGPSSRLGVMPGDKIIKVNGHDFVGPDINNKMVMDSLRGPIGTQVTFTVLRGNLSIDFDVTRGAIPMVSVDVDYMIDETVGYVRIDRFAERTYDEMMLAITRLRVQGCQTVVIDLRGNTGGFLNVVIQMCNEFLQKNDMIVYTEGLHQPREDVRANGQGVFKDLGVVVLIDEFSASASEIFAGAMQDNDRGVVVGRRSFGKGLVQQQHQLSDGSGLRITVARYHTPSGRCIQKPYEKGSTDYYSDILKRYESGEAFSADSVKFDQSQMFKTRSGRTVYGGGGIMPDIFVPSDTTRASHYLQQLRSKNLIYYFAVDYVNQHREKMAAMENDELIEHLRNIDFVPDLIRFGQKKGLRVGRLADDERKIIGAQLRAYIGRNVRDEKLFYPFVNELDPMVLKAVDIAQPVQ